MARDYLKPCAPRNGKVFRLRQHLERITRSAQTLGIAFSLGETQLAEMTEELLEANALADARLRLTITKGDLHAATMENPTPPVTLILSAAEFQPYPPALYEKGMTVIISRHKQNPESPHTGHKTTSYLDRLMGLRDAQQTLSPSGGGAGEALWFTAQSNLLAEGSISNIFLVDKAGLLCTPPLTIPNKTNQRLCLPGITRQVILELSAALNILPQERLLTIEDLLTAKEVFLTNAIMGLMPVTQIEPHPVNESKIGDLTQQLRLAYDKLLVIECP